MQTQHKSAANRQTKRTIWAQFVCTLPSSTPNHRHLLLLSPKADTHFTVPRMVEGWRRCAWFTSVITCC